MPQTPPPAPARPAEPDPDLSIFPKCPDVPLERVLWRIDSNPVQVRGDRGRARYISYVDARTAAEILDEWVGPNRWQARYEQGDLFGSPVLWCHLEIEFPDGSIRTRSDVGVYSEGRGKTKADKQNTGLKGVVSDAFKRAAAAFGVARNVYHLPEVWAAVKISGDKAYPADGVEREILEQLRRRGVEADGVRVDETSGGDDDGDDTPDAPFERAETSIPDHSEQIENGAKLAVWKLLGEDEEGRPLPDTKHDAARLWTQAFERTNIGDGPINETMAAKIIETAERILDGEAMKRAESYANAES